MKPIKRIIFTLILIGFTHSCDDDNSSTETNYNTPNTLDATEYYQELNVSYGNHARQKYDIYLPANRNSETKFIILINGGGWTLGDKIDMIGFRDFIRSELPNLGIVNMNYRLADDDNQAYPMQIHDITAVVNHLKDNEDFYIIDDEFGFVGVSAGGHLSLLWSYVFDLNAKTKMACSIVGPTNFTDPAYLNNNNPNLDILLALYGVDATTEFLEEVSPYHHATNTSPPTILFYGGQDPLVPTSQGVDMRDKLNDLNLLNKFTLYPSAGHGWIGLDLLDTSIKLKAFIQTCLN